MSDRLYRRLGPQGRNELLDEIEWLLEQSDHELLRQLHQSPPLKGEQHA